MSHSLEFYATREDVLSLFEAVETKRPLQYVLAGVLDAPRLTQFGAAREIEGLGIATHGDQNLEPTYLVVEPGVQVALREVPQRWGGVRYFVDQLRNPKSVAISVGGQYGNDVVIAGQIGTCTDDEDSLALFKVLAAELRRQFQRTKSYYVGPHAAKGLNAGARLTPSVRASETCDLRK